MLQSEYQDFISLQQALEYEKSKALSHQVDKLHKLFTAVVSLVAEIRLNEYVICS